MVLMPKWDLFPLHHPLSCDLWPHTNRKYRFMEKTFTQKKLGLEDKIPEFKNTLGVLDLLETKKVWGYPSAGRPGPSECKATRAHPNSPPPSSPVHLL